MIGLGALTSIAVALPLLVPGVASADPGPGVLSHLRVVHALTGHADQPLAVTVDGEPIDMVGWAEAGSWTGVAPGPHQVAVSAGADRTVATVEVGPGCRTSVIVGQPDVTLPVARLVQAEDCSHERIPYGLARITAVHVTDTDFGAVEVRAGDLTRPVEPFEPAPGGHLPAGSTTVSVGTPGGGETFQSETPELLAGAAYTVLWAGGGETPSRLVVLLDGAQAPDTPPLGRPIHTGVGGAGGWLPVTVLVVGALALAVLGFRGRARTVVPVLVAALLVTGCGSHAGPVVLDPPAPDRPPSTPGAAAAPTASSPAAAPARAVIAALGIDQRIEEMPTAAIPGLPDNLPLDDIAWITGSTSPGAVGTTALLAHNTRDGRGAFARLTDLRAGDQVDVVDARGRSWRYIVRGAAVSAKDAFPASVWAPQPVPSLALITCTAQRNAVTGIADNYVVWATLDETVEPVDHE